MTKKKTRTTTTKKAKDNRGRSGPLGPREPDPNQIAHRMISKIIERTEGDGPQKRK